MGKVVPVITNFTAGELSPRLDIRVDFSKYANGCALLENFFVHPHGGATFRSGLTMIAPAGGSDGNNDGLPVRLVDFIFSTVQAYILEFGDHYMRVYYDQGQVIVTTDDCDAWVVSTSYSLDDYVKNDGKVYRCIDAHTSAAIDEPGVGTAWEDEWVQDEIFQITTPWDAEDLAEIMFTQSADILYATHKGYKPRKITRTGHTAWTVSEISFASSQAAPTSPTATATTEASYRTWAYAVEAKVSGSYGAKSSDASCTGPDNLSATNSITISWSAVGSAQEYTIYRKVNDKYWKIGTAGAAATSFEDIGYDLTSTEAAGTGGSTPTGVSAALNGNFSARTHRYKITAVSEDLEESLPTSAASANGPRILDTENFITLGWTVASGAGSYYVYKESVEDSGVYEYLGKATDNAFVDDGTYTTDALQTPPVENDPFTGTNEYPRAVAFYQQRLWFGGTNNRPQTLWGSQIASYENMNASVPIRDDDAVIFTLLAERVNTVRWMRPAKKFLLVGTDSGEWHVAGSNDDPLTPSNVDAEIETRHGCESIPPLVIGNVVLFVERGGRRVREFVYMLEVDGYQAPDMSILSEHMTRNYKIMAWAYAQDPNGLCFAVRGDGQIMVLTYARAHEVVAWSRFVTDGLVESVAVIPGADRDELWACVVRTIDGAEKRFIELLEAEFNDDDTEDAKFMDCAGEYDAWNTDTGITMTLDPDTPDTWEAGETGTMTCTGATPFVAGDVGKFFYLRESRYALKAKVKVTAITSTSVVEVKFITDIPEAIQSVATSNYAKLVTQISGVDWLEGETLNVLVDGAVHPQVTVDSGAFALTLPAAKVRFGIPYIGYLEPMEVEAGFADGTAQTRTKRLDKVAARLYQTVGLKCGPSEDTAKVIPFRTAQDLMGNPVGVFSGDKDIEFPGEWTEKQRIVFVQDNPLPCTILGIVPRVRGTGR